MIRGQRQRVYADENVSRRLVVALRERGFDVLTAGDAGRLGDDDESQLAFAAAAGRVILSFDRSDFRRLHQQRARDGELHAGIALLPQTGPFDRLVVRASLLLDWIAEVGLAPPFLANWNDLQLDIQGGRRPSGYSDEDVRLALARV